MKSRIGMKLAVALIVVVFVGGYALYESRNLIIGPRLQIVEPASGFSTKKAVVEVKGWAKNISFISINDLQISVDELGQFREKVILFPGYNAIKVSVHDKFGRVREEIIELIRKEAKDELVRK